MSVLATLNASGVNVLSKISTSHNSNRSSPAFGLTESGKLVERLQCNTQSFRITNRRSTRISATNSTSNTFEDNVLEWKNLPCPPGFPEDSIAFSENAKARIVSVIEDEVQSPFDGESWINVMRHMAKRINWIDSEVEMLTFEAAATQEEDPLHSEFASALASADVLIGVGITTESSVSRVKRISGKVPNFICFDSSQQLQSTIRMGGLGVGRLSLLEKSAAQFGLWPKGSQGIKTTEMALSAWVRKNPDDIWFAVLVLVDTYVKKVVMLNNLRSQDLSSVQCMVENCRSQVLACLLDENCRTALGCLNSCAPTDQVCSYRCIVSYESPQLEAFSLCVLQKYNCLGLNAEIRTEPQVRPMTSFRGEALTFEVAESILIGWLGKLPYSWRVAAGQNAAYDQFPCQFQIFYKGKSRGSMWYDPVFKVRTLDGKEVWRRRHYRVRRAEIPGSFFFSVLDNGVTSKEKWQVVDVCEDLSWALFYYSGAASAAGQSYIGAVLLSTDGKWPEGDDERVAYAFKRCGIKRWEFYSVDNSSCKDPPLGLPSDAPAAQPSLCA